MRRVGSLSGGQRAGAGAGDCKHDRREAFDFGEHTAALDPKSSEIIMRLTNRFVEKSGITTAHGDA